MCEDIMLDWSCEALAFQMSRPNFSFLHPIPSPPAHFPFFLSLRSEVATAAQLSALVTEERRANMMRSDRFYLKILFSSVSGTHKTLPFFSLPVFVEISTE